MVEEPYIAVEGVHLDKKQVSLIGKQSNTLKWKDEETGVEFVKFSCLSLIHISEPTRH